MLLYLTKIIAQKEIYAGLCDDCFNCQLEQTGTGINDDLIYEECVCIVKRIVIEPELPDDRVK